MHNFSGPIISTDSDINLKLGSFVSYALVWKLICKQDLTQLYQNKWWIKPKYY